MRLIPNILLTVLLIVGAVWVYDRVRTASGGSTAAPASDDRVRLARLESRITSLAAEIASRESHTAARGPTTGRGANDPRLHAAPAPKDIPEAALARWKAGLETLRSERMQQDELLFVQRRLHELEASWTSGEHEAATQIVMAYFQAKASAFRRIQAERLDPVRGQELYDALTKAHRKQLFDALTDDDKARRIANALLPLPR